MSNQILKSTPEAYIMLAAPVELDVDLIRKIVEIYIIFTENKPKLNPAELNLMVYYMKNGYSEENKTQYIEDTGIKRKQLNVYNTALRNKGYLIKSKEKFTESFLAPELIEIRNSILKGGGMNLILRSYEEE